LFSFLYRLCQRAASILLLTPLYQTDLTKPEKSLWITCGFKKNCSGLKLFLAIFMFKLFFQSISRRGYKLESRFSPSLSRSKVPFSGVSKKISVGGFESRSSQGRREGTCG
jgi:hypothetical protein